MKKWLELVVGLVIALVCVLVLVPLLTIMVIGNEIIGRLKH